MYKAKVLLVKDGEEVEYLYNLCCPKDIKNFVLKETTLNLESEEVLLLITLDTKNKPINFFEVSRGTIDISLAHPREIIKRIFLSNASKFVLVHNHPSGEVTPSESDIDMSNNINEIAHLIQCDFLDSCIISSSGLFCSMREIGVLRG